MMRPSRIVVLLAVLLSGVARAEHFSGASITYECMGGNLYTVRLEIYLDCAGAPLTGQALNFSNSCGVTFSLTNLNPVSSVEVSPLCPEDLPFSSCNGGPLPGFMRHRYEVTVNLSPCNAWNINWWLCCRNTMQNLALAEGMYVEATLNNAGGLCDASPTFLDKGIPYVCVGQNVAYNPGATDPDGHTMAYSLIGARRWTSVVSPVSYANGHSGSQPIPGMTIDAASGQLAFTPPSLGYYVVVIRVATYTSGGTLIGTVMRDLMFVVTTCDGTPPQTPGLSNPSAGLSIGPNSVGACDGQSFCVDMVFTDDDPSATVSIVSNAAAMLPGATFQVTGTNPATARLCWTADLAALPAFVHYEASDGACPIENKTSRSIILNDCTVLPIGLASFTAKPAREKVRVEWATASEQGNAFFAVERGTDNTRFDPIGTVPGAGDSRHLRDYLFDDPEPLPGTSYYRLRQTDFDGKSSLGPVVAVSFTPLRPMVAVWDGVGGWTVSGLEEAAEWVLMDLMGRTLAKGSFQGHGPHRIGTAGLPQAPLLLRLRAGTRVEAIKLPPVY